MKYDESKRRPVTITLGEDVIEALKLVTKTEAKSKSWLINKLLYDYISCSFSGSLK